RAGRLQKRKGRWPLRAMCPVLSVSERGFYGWQRCGKISSPTCLPDQKLLVHIRAIHREVKEEYGWPRVYHELRRRGLRVGKERVRLLMQAHGVARRVKMSHEVQSKSEPLFRKVRPFCAKAHHASEGSVDDHPCAHCSRPVAARDRPATWHFTQHGGPLRGQRRRAALQATRTSTDQA